MKTVLVRFKVYNFRSIEESEWIEVSDNTCLIGTNESGKTNLLIALWKLHPANGEPIIPLNDFPRHLYSNYKAGGHEKDIFIAADFILSDDLQDEIATELKCNKEQVKRVLVQRRYDGIYHISFPYFKIDSYASDELGQLITEFETSLYEQTIFTKEDTVLQKTVKDFFVELKKQLPKESFNIKDVETLLASILEFVGSTFGRKKNLPEYFDASLTTPIQKILEAFNGKPVETTKEIRQKVLNSIPKFVYYSDYGNLDSEIYLPRVIEDFGRDDLSESARAKARTLDVLFKYVKLSPEEIYELGNDRKIIVKKVDSYDRVHYCPVKAGKSVFEIVET